MRAVQVPLVAAAPRCLVVGSNAEQKVMLVLIFTQLPHQYFKSVIKVPLF